jgi:hypothetical protein
MLVLVGERVLNFYRLRGCVTGGNISRPVNKPSSMLTFFNSWINIDAISARLVDR